VGRRISQAIDQWPQVVPDRLVIRVNWLRVGFAGLLAATVTIFVTILVTRERTLQAVSGGPSTLQLVAGPASQGTDSRSPLVPLGSFVRGPSELASAATVEIIGLPSGSVLSAGRPLGNRWRIPAAQLSGAVILPPRHFSGAVDLEAELRLTDDTLVERRSVHRAMTDPELAAQETMLFLSKAESLLVQRDISAARLVLPGRERWQRPRRAVTWRDIRGMFALPPLQRGRRPYHSANLV
jgi:hypothetical protein